MSTIVESRPRGNYIPADCPQCQSQQEYMVPPTFIGTLRVRCGSCKQTFTHPQPKPTTSTSTSNPTSSSKPSRPEPTRRGIGTDKNPIDLAYYDVLGVDSQCELGDIKKAYRRLAIKLHPDKNRDDPDAEEKFKQISIAYQVLSDPDLRHKYNEFGQKNGGGVAEPAGGFQDPEEVFGKMFGGNKFEDLIGQISIGKDMKEAFQKEDEEGDMMLGPGGKHVLTPEATQRKVVRDRARNEEKARIRKARVDKLAENLVNKLAIFTEAAKGPEDRLVGASFKEKCRLEAEELKEESYGVELLNSIGRAYEAKSSQHVASSQFAPLGWFHGAKSTFNTVSDTVSTLRSALELKAVFERLQAAEQAGLPADQMRKLEEQAAEQGMRTLWKGAKLEVESIVRETSEKVLSDPTVSREKRELRAVALGMMGEAYLSVRKEGEAPQHDDFVKVETAASKQREAAQARANATPGPGVGRTNPAPAPHVPPRPTEKATAPAPPPAASRPAQTLVSAGEKERNEKDATLTAAYKAYESKRHSQEQRPA